jgi:Protein of unknown function (DUF2917)
MRIDLQRGKLLRILGGAGSTLTAHAGSVWITEEASVRDVVLRPGKRLKLRRPGLALVEAISDAAISFAR